VENQERLELAKTLVQHLEAGNENAADELLEQIVRERESGLFMEVGRLTRELHDSLANVKFDARIAGLAETDIPDAKHRLNYVIQKTEEAANRTLNAVETLLPISEKLNTGATVITEDWSRFVRREMSVDEFKGLSNRLTEFLDEIQDDSSKIQSNLSDVLMAQDFQDLTGQVIRKIIDLVTEVEESLVRLVRCAGVKAKPQQEAEDGATRAEGPQVEGVQTSAQCVNGQDDVDSLLSSLGF
jgi:chemotaxis protein CheZ